MIQQVSIQDVFMLKSPPRTDQGVQGGIVPFIFDI